MILQPKNQFNFGNEFIESIKIYRENLRKYGLLKWSYQDGISKRSYNANRVELEPPLNELEFVRFDDPTCYYLNHSKLNLD